MEHGKYQLSAYVQEYWRNVQLGQWELALGILSFIKELAPNQFSNLLVELVLYPDKYSHGSTVLQTPVHLSSLAFQELKRNNIEPKASALPANFEMTLRFNFLLLQVKEENQTSFIQTLLQYYQQVNRNERGFADFTIGAEVQENFKDGFTDFLCMLITDQPILGVHICDTLLDILPPKQSDELRLIITSVFTKQAFKYLDQWEIKDSVSYLKYLDYSDNNSISQITKFQDTILEKREIKKLTQFYSKFLNYFYTQFVESLEKNEISYRLKTLDFDTDDVVATAKFFSNLIVSTDVEQCCDGFVLSKTSSSDFMSSIMNCCDLLIKKKVYIELPLVLRNLKKLTPLVLLKNWDECKCFEEALNFLNSIRNLLDCDCDDEVLGITCKQLVYQTDLIDWCLEKTKEILGSGYDGGPMVNKLFKQIDSSSVLSILNGANLLKTLKFDEVTDLLQKKPSENATSPDHMQEELDNFICFSMLKKYLQIIIAVYVGYLYGDDGSKVPFQIDYIKEGLSNIKDFLFKIKSIHYRVEMLENIFSLLFIRSTDLQSQNKEDDIDSDIVEEMSLYSSTISRSMDSLSTIGDEVIDVCSSTPSKRVFSFRESGSGDVLEDLIQEIEESSTETLNAPSIPSNSKAELHFPFPVFLVNKEILIETLKMLDECLLKFRTSKLKENADKDFSEHSVTQIDKRISKLEQHVKEGHWRCKLIVDDENHGAHLHSVESLRSFKKNVINDMLGSPENLVYLTLSKEDLFQAKQVVKLYNLQESKCSLEVDFITEYEKTKANIIEISKSSTLKEMKETQLSPVMSATQSGKMTLEISQILNDLHQHEYLGNLQSKLHLSAVALDFMFSSTATLNVCKALLDTASSSLTKGDHGISMAIADKINSQIKINKALLHYFAVRDIKYFQFTGLLFPKDFVSLVLYLPNEIKMANIDFHDSKLSQGILAFEDILSHIDFVQGTDLDELEKTQNWSLTKLKEKSQIFLSIFNVETLSELNCVNIVFDYFKSFLRYVEKLSTWQMTWSKSIMDINMSEEDFSSRPTIYNPFTIFSEYLTSICGDLIFNCKMPPKKLESFTKYIGLNLVNVITENCGVKYPSKKNSMFNVCEISMLCESPIVLNQCQKDFLDDRSPNIVVEECLSSLLEMVSDFNPTELTASEVCQIIQTATAELSTVSISLLKTDNEKRSFYINLFNLMYTHGILVILSGKADLAIEIDSQRLSCLLQSPFYRLLLLKLFCYNVGELGLITAFDVYFYFITQEKCNMFFNNIMKDVKHENLFHSYLPVFNDRCLFSVSFGTIDSQEIKVLQASTVDNMLEIAATKYFDHHFFINQDEKQLYVPEFIIQHECMFTGNQQNNSSEVANGNFVKLLENISELSYVSEGLKQELKEAIADQFSITIQPTNWNMRRSISHKSSYSFSESGQESPNLYSIISEGVSSYLQTSYPIIGSLVEIALSKSQLVKDMNVIFNNNILSRDNEKEHSLDMLPSLQHGLSNFTKISSHYKPLKNFILESSSLFIKYIELIHGIQDFVPNYLMQDVYSISTDILSKLLLLTLSPQDWISVLPALIPSFLQIGKCSFLLEGYQEYISFLPSHINDLLLMKIVEEVSLSFVNDQTDYFQNKNCHALKIVISLLRNVSWRSEAIIDQCEYLSTEDAKELLLDCLYHTDKDCELYTKLNDLYRKIHWLDKVSDSLLTANQMNLLSWQQVAEKINESPEEIVNYLNKNKMFIILDEWPSLYPMPDELLFISIKSKLDDLLSVEKTLFIEVQTVLNHVHSQELSLKICEKVLLENESYYAPNMSLIYQYITLSLSHLLDQATLKKYLFRRLVITAIEAIPKDIKESFIQIKNDPVLVFEQLILNLKISIAKDIFLIFQKEANIFPAELSSLLSECNELIANYAKKSLTLPEIKLPAVPALTQSPSKSSLEKQAFAVPLQSVNKKDWIPDEHASLCMICSDPFNMFNRRHHCRHCGRVVCAACSSHFCLIARYKRKERVCTTCFQQNYLTQSETSTEREFKDPTVPHRPLILHSNEIVHILSNDIHYNKTITTDFIFEQSPSASLCVALVDLHSNPKAAGGLLLQYANTLSNHLKSAEEREVDMNMITGMIKFMLKHAKLKFMKSSDFNGVELCDANLARIDILILLLMSNWDDIPTMQELTKPEALRRIRDKLVENEQYSLAIEITSKCGLDVTPVLFRMAITRLKYGDLKKAREMFSRCLTTVGVDSSKSFSPNNHYLEQIVDVIENSTFVGSSHAFIMSDSNQQPSFVSTVTDYFQSTVSEYGLDKNRFDEIYFYLTTYGGHNQVLSFLIRHQLLSKAVSYVKDMKCSADTFISVILLPSFQEGFFTNLCEHMRICDASLRMWQPYITESCKYLTKNNLYHCLYEVQLFIKDYFRAALICVRFYLGTATGQPATCYGDLHRRIAYLEKANHHLENLVKERNSRSSFVSHIGPSFLNLDRDSGETPTHEIKRHSNTINLQLSVMEYLYQTNYLQKEDKRSNEKIPTLFGNGKERAELTIQLLLISVEESLPLASRIIQEFKLPSSAIFGRTCKRLASLHQSESIIKLLKKIDENGMVSSKEKDEILLAVIKVLVKEGEVKNTSMFLKLIKSDMNKINALISCGRLRDAYIEAVKNDRVTEVQRILDEAKQIPNQKNLVDICEKWLRLHLEKQNNTPAPG